MASPEPQKPAEPAKDEDLRFKLGEAAGAKQALEAENQRLQALLASNRSQQIIQPPPAPAPVTPDPLEKYVAEDLTLPPEEKRRLLNDGIGRRVNAQVQRVAQELEQRNLAHLTEAENRMALQNLMAAEPDIAGDTEGIAAAMTRAKIRAERQGMQLSGPELLRLGVQVYKESRTPQPGQVVEGASRPGEIPGSKAAEPPKAKSWFERKYGASNKDTLEDAEPDFEKMLDTYLDKKNGPLAEHGVKSFLREIVEQDENRRAPERASLLPEV